MALGTVNIFQYVMEKPDTLSYTLSKSLLPSGVSDHPLSMKRQEG
jgi:hypothetical protein